MIAASPPNNEKGGPITRLSSIEKTDGRLLLQRLRFVKSLHLTSWQSRVDNLFAEFIRTGHRKHLQALNGTLAGIQQKLIAP
ncbi:MAG: hypothetical protein DME86_01225 [Verrucomicrobia bacterium]|nr:MAG: hypothetical protein DME86_01225 [Verrucomicrobiota bacterium]